MLNRYVFRSCLKKTELKSWHHIKMLSIFALNNSLPYKNDEKSG